MASAAILSKRYFFVDEPGHSDGFDPVMRALWKEHAKFEGYSLQDFAREMAPATGGKWLKNLEVYISYKGRDLRLEVDPQESCWFSRLRSEIAQGCGLDVKSAARIALYTRSGQEITDNAKGIDLLAKAPVYSLRVVGRDADASYFAPPARPDYSFPAGDFSKKVPAADAPDTEATDEDVQKLVEVLRGLLARKLPQKLSESSERDLDSVQSMAIGELMSEKNYGGTHEHQAFWNSTKCPDRGAAITELSRDVACKLVELDLGFAATPELTQRSLIGCNLWDDLHRRICRWRQKRRCYRPCPVEAESDACYISSPLGEDEPESTEVSAVQRLIAASRQDSYANNTPLAANIACHARDCDDQPDHHSIRCAKQYACYRRRQRYPLECNSTVQCLPPRRAQVVLGTHVLMEHQQQQTAPAQQQQQQQVVVMTPPSAYVGGKMGKGSGAAKNQKSTSIQLPKEQRLKASVKGKVQPTQGIRSELETIDAKTGLRRIQCKACGGSDGNKPGDVKASGCRACGGGGGDTKTAPPPPPKSPPAVPLSALPLVGCKHCDDSGKSKHIRDSVATEEPETEDPAMSSMPAIGKARLQVQLPEGAGYRLTLQQGISVENINESGQTLELDAKVYHATLYQGDKKLGHTQLPSLAQRNAYQLTVAANDPPQFHIKTTERYVAQKKALAKQALERNAEIQALLQSASFRGVLFVPSDEALSRSTKPLSLADYVYDLPAGQRLAELLEPGPNRPSMVTRGKIEYKLANTNTAVWKQNSAERVTVLGMLPHNKDVILVILDGTAADVANTEL